MTINKDKFVFCMTEAIEEIKAISERSKIIDSYFQKMNLYKVDRLYSLLNELVNKRLMSMKDEEVENYRQEKIHTIVNSINRNMLDLEKQDSSDVKTKIESLIKTRTQLESETIADIKKRLISELKLDNIPSDDKEVDMIRRMYNNEGSFEEFVELFKKHREIERELKVLKIERELIASDLIPTNANYNYTQVDVDSLLTIDGFKKLEGEITTFIQKSTDEEIAEKDNFGEVAKKAYFSTICFDSTSNPIDRDSLEYLKDKLENNSRLYDTASLEIEEWQSLNSKIFKTTEVLIKISNLEKEIRETKKKINKEIREWYKNYYTNNDLYKPVVARRNDKLIYYIGYEYLEDFFLYGKWPNKETIHLLSITRELNRKEAEKEILKIELTKEKHSNILTNHMADKELELQKIADKMTELVPDWKNTSIIEIIENYLYNSDNKKRNRSSIDTQ